MTAATGACGLAKGKAQGQAQAPEFLSLSETGKVKTKFLALLSFLFSLAKDQGPWLN